MEAGMLAFSRGFLPSGGLRSYPLLVATSADGDVSLEEQSLFADSLVSVVKPVLGDRSKSTIDRIMKDLLANSDSRAFLVFDSSGKRYRNVFPSEAGLGKPIIAFLVSLKIDFEDREALIFKDVFLRPDHEDRDVLSRLMMRARMFQGCQILALLDKSPSAKKYFDRTLGGESFSPNKKLPVDIVRIGKFLAKTLKVNNYQPGELACDEGVFFVKRV